MSALSTMKLDIVSAEASIFTGQVSFLSATGKGGELGIYPGHTALITMLKPGQIAATLEDGKQEFFYISSGMLEVQPNCVTVLADTAMRAADLDEASANLAKEQSEKTLENQKSGIEYSKAMIELAEASAQLRAIQKLRENLRK